MYFISDSVVYRENLHMLYVHMYIQTYMYIYVYVERKRVYIKNIFYKICVI